MNTAKINKRFKHILLNIITWLAVFLVIFPLLWMFLSSIKHNTEIFASPPTIISKDPTLTNFIELFKLTSFERYFLNSLIVTALTIIITIVIATLTAYTFSRFKIKGSGFLSRIYIFIYLIPQIALIIPVFLTFRYLHLQDKLIGLVLVYLITTFPYSFLMLRSYIGSISKEMEEAAMVDGCSRFTAFIRIILPIAVPGIVATSIFSAVICWNEFLFSFILISTDSKKTLTVGVAQMTDMTVIPSWGMLMAAGVIVLIPMIIFFIAIQKRLVVGLSAGAVKG